MRKVSKEQQAGMEVEVESLIHKHAHAIYEAEKALRDGQAYKEQYQRLQELCTTHAAESDSELNRLQVLLNDAYASKEKEAQGRREIQEQNKELRMLVDKYRLQVSHQ